jgi:hypothetical protein
MLTSSFTTAIHHLSQILYSYSEVLMVMCHLVPPWAGRCRDSLSKEWFRQWWGKMWWKLWSTPNQADALSQASQTLSMGQNYFDACCEYCDQELLLLVRTMWIYLLPYWLQVFVALLSMAHNGPQCWRPRKTENNNC